MALMIRSRIGFIIYLFLDCTGKFTKMYGMHSFHRCHDNFPYDLNKTPISTLHDTM